MDERTYWVTGSSALVVLGCDLSSADARAQPKVAADSKQSVGSSRGNTNVAASGLAAATSQNRDWLTYAQRALPRGCVTGAWRLTLTAAWTLLLSLLAAARVGAQDIRDVVREHLEEKLEHKPAPKKRDGRPRPKRDSRGEETHDRARDSEREPDRGPEGAPDRARDGESEPGDERSRERGQAREAQRDQARDGESKRERDRAPEGERDRAREAERERERDRAREADRERERDRAREAERERVQVQVQAQVHGGDRAGVGAPEDVPSVGDAAAMPPPSAAASLPRRVFEQYVQLDVSLGGGYRGWLPQQFPHVKVAVGSYYVWTIDVKLKLFKLVTLHRGYYESNGLAGPRTDQAAVAAQVGSYIPKAAWVLGVLGFPWFKVWEPILRYESRAFHTTARPRQAVCVVTDEVARDLSQCRRSKDKLDITSGFETFVAGVRYDQGRNPDRDPNKDVLPPLTFGIGLLSYRKPYQVNVNGNTLDGYLFDGRFRGAGLQLGIDFNRGPDKFSFNVDAQLGLGEVKLTDALTLNSLAPENWWMGYVVGNANLSYSWPLYRGVPTIMLVPSAALSGASFFFFKTKPDKGQDQSDVAAANWDLLWSIYASLVVSL